MDLPNPEIKPGSSALQEDYLPTVLSGKPRTPDIWPQNHDINIILFAEQRDSHDSQRVMTLLIVNLLIS